MRTPRIACAIDRGRRDNLEDALAASHFRIHQPGDLEVTWMVDCDGVCGELFGEVASALGVRHTGRALTD
ncbi:MAG TPA: hypothetical protein VM537_27145, partial [Anaerolineae bacterium]|nr:hypothetical protein [Anaerolineae bacterium]